MTLVMNPQNINTYTTTTAVTAAENHTKYIQTYKVHTHTHTHTHTKHT